MEKELKSMNNRLASSFTCCICGELYDPYDDSTGDIRMVHSNQGTFCSKHINKIRVGKYLKDLITKPNKTNDEQTFLACIKDRNKDLDYIELVGIHKFSNDMFYTVCSEFDVIPNEFCPIFNMDYILDKDIIGYLLTKHDYNKQTIVKEIRDNFKNYSGLLRFNEMVKML